jgi:membrane fusion protein (multidrug efflux system)
MSTDQQPVTGAPETASAAAAQNTAPAAAASGSAGTGAASRSARRRWLAVVTGAFVVVGAGYGAYWAMALRNHQSTDDAYVSGNVVQITPQIAGTVVSIAADDTNFVKAGQTLVQLDPADARIALEQADARLGKTVREVRSLFATTAQLKASVDVRNSEVARASEDLNRRERLASSGAVSGEELQHARDALTGARAALVAAQQELAAHLARVDGTTVSSHPDVLAASAQVHDAYLDVARTQLPAPVSGYVAKRAVQLGQRVAPGAPLMAIVPLDQVWIDANFKEPQLAAMRVGQPATIKADLYGRKVVYHGTVAGFGAGTGSAFALLPAQNATGNWIKIVQRVPVRIALDARELAAHPLQIGLSMQVDVDTHERDGARMPQLTQSGPASQTRVYDTADDAARQRIAAIIAANGHGAIPATNLARGDDHGSALEGRDARRAGGPTMAAGAAQAARVPGAPPAMRAAPPAVRVTSASPAPVRGASGVPARPL